MSLIAVRPPAARLRSRLIQVAYVTSLGCLCPKPASFEIFGCKYVCMYVSASYPGQFALSVTRTHDSISFAPALVLLTLSWTGFRQYADLFSRFFTQCSLINTYFGSNFSFYRSPSCRVASHALLFETINVKYHQSK